MTATDCSHRATYCHATYSGGNICESGSSVNDNNRLQPQRYFHATYSGGSICESGSSVHDSNRLQLQCYFMLLILMEVSVKVACRSTTATDCRHRAITMQLILVQVSVKVACPCTTAIDCSHRAITMLFFSGASICESGLSVHDSHRLQAQSYHHATYSGGSICEFGLSLHNSHRAITMLLILVEVSVKVACRSTTATELTPCYLFWW